MIAHNCHSATTVQMEANSNRVPISVLLLVISAEAIQGQPLLRHVPKAIRESIAIGQLSEMAQMRLAVGLRLGHPDDLDRLVNDLLEPSSPRFQHYLTMEQFVDLFSISEADYNAVADFLSTNGLQVVGRHANRMILEVEGNVADVERTFQVQLIRWRHPQRGEFFAPDREPTLDANLPILDISGLDNFVVSQPMALGPIPHSEEVPMGTGSGPYGLFIGGDFRAAYAPGVSLNGSGQVVGLFELDGFYSSDLKANFAQAGLPEVPVTTVLTDGFSGIPGSANIEVMLNIMMAAYMAPGLSTILVYEGTIPNVVLNRMATDNLASQLSSSWLYPTNATTEQIFKEMVVQGQSFFQASGDSGAYSDSIMSPADEPNVTIVGGTSLRTAGKNGPWQSETAWARSGGGISTRWPIPFYQRLVNLAAAGGSLTMRNVPDVALTADVQMFLIQNNGQAVAVGGTSAAAPLWAGFMALANQQAAASNKPRIGFLNPLIYQIGSGPRLDCDLHDIVTGDNGEFPALPGYDLATGWGSPAGQSLIDDLSGISNAQAFELSFSTPGPAVSAGENWSATIKVIGHNGFAGAVNLAIAGLPPGVTASLSPAVTRDSSVLMVSVAPSAALGRATLTITGTSSTLMDTGRLAFSILATPSVKRRSHQTTARPPWPGTLEPLKPLLEQRSQRPVGWSRAPPD